MPYVFLLLILAFALPGSSLHAQVDLTYGQTPLSIETEPAFPIPGETFTVKANDYSLPVQGTGLRWVVDGKPVPEGDNLRSIRLTAKASQQPTVIELIVDLPGGAVVSAVKRVEPIYLDIIVEPQTRTPAFYRGRALPTYQSTVNATAVLNGGQLLPSGHIYTWRLNNTTLEGGAMRGNSSVSFTVPRGEVAIIGLEVADTDGTIIARRNVSMRIVEPTLAFYEVSALYGLSTRAITNSLPLVGSSLSVRAEPYYLDLGTYNNPDLLEWQIDNVVTQNTGVNPYEVTMAQNVVGGSSIIEFHVRNLKQVLQGAQGSFRLTY